MQIKNNYIPLAEVRYCGDQQTVQEAMDFLESVGYRCVPVLTRADGTYLGNIYLDDRNVPSRDRGTCPSVLSWQG